MIESLQCCLCISVCGIPLSTKLDHVLESPEEILCNKLAESGSCMSTFIIDEPIMMLSGVTQSGSIMVSPSLKSLLSTQQRHEGGPQEWRYPYIQTKMFEKSSRAVYRSQEIVLTLSQLSRMCQDTSRSDEESWEEARGVLSAEIYAKVTTDIPLRRGAFSFRTCRSLYQ